MKFKKQITAALFVAIGYSPIAMADPDHTAGHAHEMTHEANQSDVAKTLRSYATALQANDMKTVESFVAKNGTEFTIFEGKGANIGWADYRDNHLAPELSNPDFKITKYEFTNISETVSSDWASATFAINMDYTYKGEDKTANRRGTAILKRIEGKWILTHLHTS
ncbi:MAG: hypothetical protein COA47_01890 [Robiginitomaculum sp.]|nr:MAG: hypothetical protein COA47_01890 [Robiginitomaculum sp.]